MMTKYTKQQLEFSHASDEECEKSLEKISRLFEDLESEVNKWNARGDSKVANNLSGGLCTLDEALDLFHEMNAEEFYNEHLQD